MNCGPEGLDQGALLGGGCGVLQQQPAAPGMADVVVHKRQAVIDRLKRRMEGYRRHNQDCVPRYNNAFVEQQNVQETLMLKQKYMETKTKRNVKKNDKKPMENGNTMPPVSEYILLFLVAHKVLLYLISYHIFQLGSFNNLIFISFFFFYRYLLNLYNYILEMLLNLVTEFSFRLIIVTRHFIIKHFKVDNC